jgi:hypothetical protein
MQLQHGRRYRFSDASAGDKPGEQHVHLWLDQAGPAMPAAPGRRTTQPAAGGVEEEVFADGRRRVRLVGRDQATGQNYEAALYLPEGGEGFGTVGGRRRRGRSSVSRRQLIGPGGERPATRLLISRARARAMRRPKVCVSSKR